MLTAGLRGQKEKCAFPRAFVTTLVSLLVHDVLDLAQATDRLPAGRCLVGRRLRSGAHPDQPPREAAVLNGLLLAFLALRHAAHRWAPRA